MHHGDQGPEGLVLTQLTHGVTAARIDHRIDDAAEHLLADAGAGFFTRTRHNMKTGKSKGGHGICSSHR
jgi:hypothetical protein